MRRPTRPEGAVLCSADLNFLCPAKPGRAITVQCTGSKDYPTFKEVAEALGAPDETEDSFYDLDGPGTCDTYFRHENEEEGDFTYSTGMLACLDALGSDCVAGRGVMYHVIPVGGTEWRISTFDITIPE